MRQALAATVATLLAALTATVVCAPPAYSAAPAGIRVQDGRLVEASGSDLILRGVNHDYMWYPDRNEAFAGIKATGANAVRVPLGIGTRWPADTATDVASIVAQCKQNRLICLLDAHDTTGFGPQPGAASMAQAVDFWLGVQGPLMGEEDYVIINIANEPYGNGTRSPWVAETTTAIHRLRAAGFRHTFMVDAPGWGQDESFVMRDNARTVLAADPSGNTVFDVHMYGMFTTAEKVQAYLKSFVGQRLPIVVGEFSAMHEWGNPDEDAIMAYTQAYKIGYLGWSWSGNSPEYRYLDMVGNFDAGQRSAWGDRFVTGPNGLSTTAREATVFRNDAEPAAPRAVNAPPAPRNPIATGVTADRFNLSWRPAPGGGGVVGYDVVLVGDATENRIATTRTNSVSITGLRESTPYAFAVYARDMFGNRSARSATVHIITRPADLAAPAGKARPAGKALPK